MEAVTHPSTNELPFSRSVYSRSKNEDNIMYWKRSPHSPIQVPTSSPFQSPYREIFRDKSGLLVTRWRQGSAACEHGKIKSTFLGIFLHTINR